MNQSTPKPLLALAAVVGFALLVEALGTPVLAPLTQLFGQLAEFMTEHAREVMVTAAFAQLLDFLRSL